MGRCVNCGGKIRSNYKYCSNSCLHQWHERLAGGGVSVIESICREGARALAVAVIRHALLEEDFRWIYSRDSDLYFDIADLQKHEVMDGYDDDLNKIYVKKRKRMKFELPPEFDGMTQTQVAKMHGMAQKTLNERLRRGMSWEEALSTPLRR